MDELRIPSNPADAREPTFLERVKSALRLPEEVELEFARLSRDSEGGLLEYIFMQPILLQGPDYGPADGVTVQEPTSARLRFDKDGMFVSFQVSLVDEQHLHSVQEQVRGLAAADQISPVSSDLSGRPAFDLGPKPWYVAPDAKGRKRLKRAFVI